MMFWKIIDQYYIVQENKFKLQVFFSFFCKTSNFIVYRCVNVCLSVCVGIKLRLYCLEITWYFLNKHFCVLITAEPSGLVHYPLHRTKGDHVISQVPFHTARGHWDRAVLCTRDRIFRSSTRFAYFPLNL